MGVAVWPMVELEADDALASAARIAAEDPRVEKVCIWTPDKDLAQCVRDDRVVQVDRKAKKIRDAEAVREKFGVEPRLIPDYLALVGDAADGYPGIPGIGAVGAARLLNRHGADRGVSAEVLGERRELALLFKRLATLRTDAPLFAAWRSCVARTDRRLRPWTEQGECAALARALPEGERPLLAGLAVGWVPWPRPPQCPLPNSSGRASGMNPFRLGICTPASDADREPHPA